MSGNDNDRGGGGGGGGPGQPDCSSLRFRTTLASPDLDSIAHLHVGEVLVVTLEDRDGVSIIAVRTSGTAFVGTIASDQARRLRECLQRGLPFQAVVLSIEGAAVRVEVSRAE